MRHARSFWFAVQFLTRLPTPSTATLGPREVAAALAASRLWFPFVGGLVGGLTALAWFAASRLWPGVPAILIALATEALATGALHEDAVADLADAVGGGATREARLAILKDSRIGAYGALGLGLAVGLRVALLAALAGAWPPAHVATALITAGVAGRWTILCMMAAAAPVPGRAGLAADLPRLPAGKTVVALLLAAPLLAWAAWLMPLRLGAGLLICALFAPLFARWITARLGGTVGDALGSGAYAGGLITLAAFAARAG